jgi:hypothetical protein
MGKEASISVSWEARQALLFGNGHAGKPDELGEFIEGAVEAGGVIDPRVLASDLGCSQHHITHRLQEHPLTQVFDRRNGQVRFRSNLEPPADSLEGIAALQEQRRGIEDTLGREAREDFHSLVAERAQMSAQKKRGRTRVIRKF